MNEQELQQAYTRHCEITGQTKMTRTGFEAFKAGFRLGQHAAGEPVAWQMIHRHHPNPSWQNCPKELFDQYEAYHKQYGGESPVRALVVAAPPAAAHGDEAVRWVPCSERMPEPGVTVMVYTPPQRGDYPDSVRISFDGICPESDGDYWVDHGEHYEHWCCMAKGGDDIEWHGPSEKAPYTHWMPLPKQPVLRAQAGEGGE